MAEYYQLTDVGLSDFEPLFTKEALISFKTDPNILAVGAGDEGQASGVMLVKITEFLIHITYIYVAEKHRKRGIANGLLDLAEDIAFNEEKPLMAMICAEDESDPLYRLFRDRPSFSINESGDFVYRIPTDEIGAIGNAIHLVRKNCKVVPFEDLSESDREAFYQKVNQKGVAYFDPYDQDYLAPMCFAARYHDEIKAVILMAGSGEEMSLRYLYSENPGALREILKEVAGMADRIPKEIKYLRIATINTDSGDLLRHLIPEAHKAGTFYMATMDFSV